MKIELSDLQAEYIRGATHRWNIKMGATQSGKTHLDSAYIIPQRVLERRDRDGLMFIVGVTKETIERNVLSKMRGIWGPERVGAINSRNVAKLFGVPVYCIGAKDAGQVSVFRGATASYIYVDEFPDISKDAFDILASRLSLPYSCADMTGNPKTPSHWSEEFIASDRDIFFQRYTLHDNPFLTAETVANIERDYRGTVFFDRYVLGLPKRAEGAVYPAFAARPDAWQIDRAQVPPLRRVEVGFDIGGNGSAYALCATGAGADGVQYRLLASKRQAEELNMEDIERMVDGFCERVEQEYGCSVDIVNCDHVAVVVNSLNDNTRYRAGLAYKPPVTDRVFLYSRLLANKRLLFVRGMCDDLIDEMCEMVYDERAIDARPLDDGSYQIDAYDAACYSESSYWGYIGV